jgi:hypothetical protein
VSHFEIFLLPLCKFFVSQFIDNHYANSKTHITTAEPCLRCRASDQRKRPAQATSASDQRKRPAQATFLVAPNYSINLQRCSCSMRSMNNVFYHVSSLNHKTMKKVFICAIFALGCQMANVSYAEPFEYKNIPWGKTFKEIASVLNNEDGTTYSLLSGETQATPFAIGSVADDSPAAQDFASFARQTAFIPFYLSGYKEVHNYFRNGLINLYQENTSRRSGIYGCAFGLSVKNDDWDNLNELALFFTQTKPNDSLGDYILFMVAKEHKSPQDDNYIDVFNGYRQNITQTLGVSPKIYDTKWKTIYDSYYPAKIAEYTTKSRKIFLMVDRRNKPIILYADLKGWNKYLNTIKQYKIKNEKAAKNKNKPSF